MPKWVLGSIITVVVVAIAAVVVVINQDDSSDTNTSQTENTSSQTAENESSTDVQIQQETSQSGDTATQSGEFTVETVAMHSTATDCWTIINDEVYDLTSYVPRHPGGDEILRACGTDGTSLFETKTTETGETVGTGQPHSSRAESALAELKLGPLSQ